MKFKNHITLQLRLGDNICKASVSFYDEAYDSVSCVLDDYEIRLSLKMHSTQKLICRYPNTHLVGIVVKKQFEWIYIC